MKRAFVIVALLFAAAVADAANVGVSNTVAAFDPRGRTSEVSADILLNTKVPRGTLILLR